MESQQPKEQLVAMPSLALLLPGCPPGASRCLKLTKRKAKATVNERVTESPTLSRQTKAAIASTRRYEDDDHETVIFRCLLRVSITLYNL